VNDLRDDAVVLRTYRSGEADRVVVMWSRQHGKIRAIAKGVRKPTSKIGGALQPLAHVGVFLARGRGELWIVRQVQHLSQHPVLHADYDRLTSAMAVVEVVDAIPSDDVADEEIFTLLVRTLGALDDPRFLPALVPAAFFLRLLAHDGSEPVVTECVSCATPGPLVAFDAAAGGASCAACRSGRPISPDALALLRRLLGGELAAVLAEGSPRGAGEVMSLAQEAVELHFGRRLKVARSAPHLGGVEARPAR
jgi:DNA repair protein RecO (recombination protein O)